jgi:hypothetical protein
MHKLAMMILAAFVVACGGAKDAETTGPAPKPVEQGSTQTFNDGIRAFCDAGKDPSVVNSEPANKATALVNAVERTVTNPDALQMFKSLSAAEAEAKREVALEAIGKAGIAEGDCEIMKAWPGPSGADN